MNAIQQIKAILEGAGRRVYYIRDAVFTASWLVQNCEFPAVLLFERRLRQFQHEGVGAWRELCECKMVCVTTTAYEFQTPENDAIQETQKTEALSLCSLLRQSQMFDRFDVGQALAVYDGAVGVLLTGCSVDLTASTLAGECGTPPDAGKIITENGRTDVLGLSWVEVNVQGGTPAVVEPLEVEPTTEAQTFNPPAGVDGYAPVVVGACPVCPAPLLQSKSVTPTTSQQTVTPDVGYDGLDEVEVDAVTAAIDANITPGNIKKDVQILGVTGTMQEGTQVTGVVWTNPTINPLALAPNAICTTNYAELVTEIDDTEMAQVGLISIFVNIEICRVHNATTLVTSFNDKTGSKLREFYGPKVTTILGYRTFRYNSRLETVTYGVLSAVANWSQMFTLCYELRIVVVGADTAISLNFGSWSPTNVIAEGQTGVDELNYNIKTYLADKVADRTNDTALTITFGAALYNVLTAETITAFTAKNWNVASA